MAHIVLTEDQVKMVKSSVEPIEVWDTQGCVLGTIAPLWSEAEIAEAKSRLASDEPRYSFQQVLEHIRSLELK